MGEELGKIEPIKKYRTTDGYDFDDMEAALYYQEKINFINKNHIPFGVQQLLFENKPFVSLNINDLKRPIKVSIVNQFNEAAAMVVDFATGMVAIIFKLKSTRFTPLRQLDKRLVSFIKKQKAAATKGWNVSFRKNTEFNYTETVYCFKY